MNKKIFYKEYTRDNGLIIQGIWSRIHMEDSDNKKNPFLPSHFFYLNNGMVEIWENHQAISWIKDRIYNKNKNGPDFFHQRMLEYNKQLLELNKYWSQDYLSSIGELKKYLKLMGQASKNFLIFYYSALDKRTSAKIKQQALKIRDKDTFYDDSNRLIKNTLEHLHPEFHDLTVSILDKDLNNLPRKKILKERFKNFIMIMDNTFKIVKFDDFLSKNKAYKFIIDKVPSNNQVRGHVSYHGKVGKIIGRVRILKRKSQISGMRNGEIIISPMTTPDFVSAMEKATAFVTDEGGIMCHASIIARELKKTCIVGTRVATKIFKDGDKVEVDTSNGIVKKINN